MRPTLLLVMPILAVNALAACSGDEGPAVVEPVTNGTPEPTSTVVATDDAIPEETTTFAEETPVAGEALADAEIDSTIDRRTRSLPTPDPRSREERLRAWGMYDPTPLPSPTPLTLPTVEFPDDIALIALLGPSNRGVLGDSQWALDLVRIYRQDGQLIRETLFSPEHLEEGYVYYFPHIASPDASSIILTACVQVFCDDSYPSSGTTIFESVDGGITWEGLDTFDIPWVASRVLSDGGEGIKLVMEVSVNFLESGTNDYGARPHMLWPDGMMLKPPMPPDGYYLDNNQPELSLDDGRLAWGMRESGFSSRARSALYLTEDGEDVTDLVLEQTDSCPKCLHITANRGLLLSKYNPIELIGPRGAAVGFYEGPSLRWPTIRYLSLRTGNERPIRLPVGVLKADGRPLFSLLAVQQGPFLLVVGVDDCLPVRADHSPDAEELDCMAERVLLQDQGGDVITDDGVTWRRVRTPAGIEGWANGRYLELISPCREYSTGGYGC